MEQYPARDEMIENGGQPFEVYDSTRMRLADDKYRDKVLGLADAIRFTLDMEQ